MQNPTYSHQNWAFIQPHKNGVRSIIFKLLFNDEKNILLYLACGFDYDKIKIKKNPTISFSNSNL
jgi:hypothetical protein